MSELTELASNVEDKAPDSYHDKMVGDGKQYADNEALAKGKANADLHISELQDKLDAATDEQTSINEVLEEIRKQPSSDEGEGGPETSAPAPTVNPEDVTDLVDKRVAEVNAKEQAKHNTAETLKLLTAHYGSQDTALRAVKTANAGNPIFRQTINDLGNTDPKAAFDFVTGRVSITGGSNTPGVGDAGSAEAIVASGDNFTYSYCVKVRKENPDEYKKPAFRRKMEEAVVEHGDEWFDT